MNRQSLPASTSRRFRKIALAAVVAAACPLFATSALAQVLVTDVPAETSANAAVTKQIAQYAKQLEQLTHEVNTDVQTLETYQALISSITNVINNPIGALIPPNSNMPHISTSQISALTQYQCGSTSSSGGSGSILGSLVNAIHLGGNNIPQMQQQICSDIVFVQADSYNATADLYNQMPQFHKSLSGLSNLMSSINNVEGGNASAQATTFSAQQKQAIADWKSRTTMDKDIVESLQAQQSTLAKQLMHGTPGLAGDAIQTAAFAAAFQ